MKLSVYKWYFLAGSIAIVALMAGLSFLNQEEDLENDLFADVAGAREAEDSANQAALEESAEPKEIKVDVKGAVLVPGLYVALDGERVFDLVEKAGGFTVEADSNLVNLAQIVEDEMVIYVPVIGEEGNIPLQAGIGSADTGNAQEEQKINLNTASEMELQTLTGIGTSKAAAIIRYRTENGPFKSIEELKNISGIGAKTYEKLKEEIAI